MAAQIMAHSVCFISAKGGSGKTVTSSALGTFLASLGFRVLLVDTDAATNGMTLLYLEQLLGRRRTKRGDNSVQAGLFEVSAGETPSHIVISENLHLVPAAYTMRETVGTDHQQFSDALKSLQSDWDKYDFVFLDAQAGTDTYAKIAAGQAEQCVIVSEYDPVSAQGIERLKVLFANIIDPSETWTLFNKVLPEFTKVIGEGLSIARYLTPIPWDADVVRAFARRDLAINMKAPNPYTLAIAQVAYNLFPDEAGNAIDLWRNTALNEITSPVKERLKELAEAKVSLKLSERRRELLRAIASSLIATIGIVVGVVVLIPFVARDINFDASKELLLPFISKHLPDVAIFGVTIVGLIVAFLTIIMQRFRSQRFDFNEYTMNLIAEEQQKLSATLDAAEATLKLSDSTGYYQQRRRAPKPDRLPKSPPSQEIDV